jgi:hypothetical protein
MVGLGNEGEGELVETSGTTDGKADEFREDGIDESSEGLRYC